MTTDTPTLAPCPFCGEVLTVTRSRLATHSQHSKCFLRVNGVDIDNPDQVAAWNCRPDRSPAGEVRVKPLEWEDIGYGWAKTSWGGYTITDRYGTIWNEAFGWEHSSRRDGDRSEEEFESIEAAKAAAQADYEARILAALSLAPAPEREGLLLEALRMALFEIGSLPGTEVGTIKARRIAAAALAAYEEGRK